MQMEAPQVMDLSQEREATQKLYGVGEERGGMVYGQTDEFGYYIAEHKVTIPDLHATLLHLLGFDHTQLTYRRAGRD